MGGQSMYIPPHFAETDQGKLHDFIEAYSFGLLVSSRDGVPYASHLPFLLDRGGPHGTLLGHMARTNPHWHGLDGQVVAAVFSGPHTYVSPSWYEAENVVPTWNYIAVHARGTFRLVDEPGAVRDILLASVATFEAPMPTPWTIDAGTDYFERMVRGIVAFRVEIEGLEGKFKLSQNQPRQRRENVIRALEKSASPDAREVARLMAKSPG